MGFSQEDFAGSGFNTGIQYFMILLGLVVFIIMLILAFSDVDDSTQTGFGITGAVFAFMYLFYNVWGSRFSCMALSNVGALNREGMAALFDKGGDSWSSMSQAFKEKAKVYRTEAEDGVDKF